jgi:hypothetical protein
VISLICCDAIAENTAKAKQSCTSRDYIIYNKEIKLLDFEDLPYSSSDIKSAKRSRYYDDSHVPLHMYKGKLNYHPVVLAQRGLENITAYVNTSNDQFLDASKNIAEKLQHIALSVDSALFFPYSFNFPLHGSRDEMMVSPWYSAMAQGQILSFFVRLYELTQNNIYLERSRKIFDSFRTTNVQQRKIPWVTCVDMNGYLWLEEYPILPPAHTLNGMIFALFGIYDYYRIVKSPASEKLLRGTIRTIKDHISQFRVKNGISHYCIKHPKVKSLGCHKIHIWQLEAIYRITGDVFFLDMSRGLAEDTLSVDQ